MLLFFLRHADAESAVTSDFDRRLTPKGLEQADKVGGFCARYGLIPDVILTSPVVRARQTAEIAARKLGGVELIQCDWLSCGMRPEVCADELGSYRRFETCMVVGHEPDFGQTIAYFIGLQDADGLKVRKASLVAVDMPSLGQGAGQLQFSVPVRLM